jgi:hypothetical protein
MHEALAPGGIYITVSLHRPTDVINHFTSEKFNWQVACYNIRNPRWVSEREFRGSCAHTLIVCCRGSDDGPGGREVPGPESVLLGPLDGVLSDDEYKSLCAEADEVTVSMLYCVRWVISINILASGFLTICLPSLTSEESFVKLQ